MERFKIVIKGKSYTDQGENLVDFGVMKKGEVNAILTALSTVVCDMFIDNDMSYKDICKYLKISYNKVLIEREEEKNED